MTLKNGVQAISIATINSDANFPYECSYIQRAMCYVVRVSSNLFVQLLFCGIRLIVNYETKQNIDPISIPSL